MAGASATVGSTVAIGAGIGVGAGELGRRRLVEAGYEGFAYPESTPSLLRNPLRTLRDGTQGTAQALGQLLGLGEGIDPNDLAGAPPPVPLSPSGGEIPFQGGQSPGVQYWVTVEGTFTSSGNPSRHRVLVAGPVQGLEIRLLGSRNDQPTWFLPRAYRNGEPRGTTIAQTKIIANLQITDVERRDGQPDTGGDPAPEPEQNPGVPNRQPLPTPGSRPGISPAPAAIPALRPAVRPAIAPPIGDPAASPVPESPQIPGFPSVPAQSPTPGVPLYPGLPSSPAPVAPSRQPSTSPRPLIAPATPGSLPSIETPEIGLPNVAQPNRFPLPGPSANPTADGRIESPPNQGQQPQLQPQPSSQKRCKDPCLLSLDNKADTADLDLKEVKAKLELLCETVQSEFGEFGTGELDLTPCQEVGETENAAGEGQPESTETVTAPSEGTVTVGWNDTGNAAILSALAVLSQGLSAIHDAVKCPPEVDGALAVPEWWAVRPGADIPQLCIVLREVDPSGKVLKSQWSFSIPHYIGPAEEAPNLPPFTKGSYFGTLTLTDNTKLTINAVSMADAEAFLNACIPYIDPQYLGNQDVHLGLRKGKSLKVANVKPYRAQFYSQGQKDTVPDWEIDFP